MTTAHPTQDCRYPQFSDFCPGHDRTGSRLATLLTRADITTRTALHNAHHDHTLHDLPGMGPVCLARVSDILSHRPPRRWQDLARATEQLRQRVLHRGHPHEHNHAHLVAALLDDARHRLEMLD